MFSKLDICAFVLFIFCLFMWFDFYVLNRAGYRRDKWSEPQGPTTWGKIKKDHHIEGVHERVPNTWLGHGRTPLQSDIGLNIITASHDVNQGGKILKSLDYAKCLVWCRIYVKNMLNAAIWFSKFISDHFSCTGVKKLKQIFASSFFCLKVRLKSFHCSFDTACSFFLDLR